MVSFTRMMPIVGKDVFGNPSNMMASADNRLLIQSRNAQSVGASESTSNPTSNPSHTNPVNVPVNKQTQTLEIYSLYSNDGKVLALGKTTFNDKTSADIVYTTASGNWVCGLSPISDKPRPNGIAYSNGNFVVATTNKTIVSDFKYNANSPAGSGLINSLPAQVTNVALGDAGQVDNLSASSSVIVAGSLTKSGTWITSSLLPANEWGHNVGEQELKLTNAKSTSYTFPGYSGTNAQIQRVCAIPNGNSPPVDWTTGDDRTNGYYGVIGGPVITVTWTK